MNRYSKILTKPKNKGPAQAMLYALGFTKNDMSKAQIGIGTVCYDSNPCNSKLNILATHTKKSINKSDFMLGLKFNTIGVSDGITMGTKGMQYSLPSRELIADSIETITAAHYYDGLICIPGCDKNLPACLMAMLRLNRPGFIIYGGAMQPNIHNNTELDIVSVFESFGKHIKNDIDEDEYQNIVENACHKNCGSCSGLYTANTMASAFEIMGITIPNSASNPSLSTEKIEECDNSVKIMENLLKNDIKPRDIITKESLENAIIFIYLLGGSTNAVIHLLAIARQANINLKLSDFIKYRDIPVLTDMKPHGKYVMNDIYKYGGIGALINYFIDEKYINGDLPTITGKTLKENYILQKDNNIKKVIKKIKNNSHIHILYGNIAPNGCILKVYDESINLIKYPIKVFNSEDDLLKSLKNGNIDNTHAILIRCQGESIGCPEMLNATSALIGYFGEGNVPPLLTDGRFSGGSRGILIAHLPDANNYKNITRHIKNNDILTIDIENNKINIETELHYIENFYPYTNIYSYNKPITYLNKYRKLVKGIEDGYIT